MSDRLSFFRDRIAIGKRNLLKRSKDDRRLQNPRLGSQKKKPATYLAFYIGVNFSKICHENPKKSWNDTKCMS